MDKLDESTCIYMIGELSYRAGYYSDAVKWFSKLMSSEEARKNRLSWRPQENSFSWSKRR